MTIIFIGAIIAVIGGLISAFGTYFQNKKSSERSERMESGINQSVEIGKSTGNDVISLKTQNQQLLEKVERQESLIDKLRKENTDLYTKLADVSRDIFDNMQGGQEAVFVQINSFKPDEHVCVLQNINKYPVYELLVEITNYDDLTNCKSITDNNRVVVDYPCFLKCSKDFKIRELGVGEYYLNDIVTKKLGRYQIRFKSRNKIFYQQLVYRKTNGIVYTASRLFEFRNGKSELLKNIPSNNKDWKVDFDEEFSKGIVTLLKTL